MNKLKITLNWIGMPGGIIVFLVAALTLIVSSCASDKQTGAGEKSGAQLWADNCQRCHNTRSPSSYNDAQWEVAMMHMRVRANLTPEEHKKILEFLKSGS